MLAKETFQLFLYIVTIRNPVSTKKTKENITEATVYVRCKEGSLKVSSENVRMQNHWTGITCEHQELNLNKKPAVGAFISLGENMTSISGNSEHTGVLF